MTRSLRLNPEAPLLSRALVVRFWPLLILAALIAWVALAYVLRSNDDSSPVGTYSVLLGPSEARPVVEGRDDGSPSFSDALDSIVGGAGHAPGLLIVLDLRQDGDATLINFPGWGAAYKGTWRQEDDGSLLLTITPSDGSQALVSFGLARDGDAILLGPAAFFGGEGITLYKD
jgi:hypothetical protein